MGILVDRFGTKVVNAAGITLWSVATMLTGGAWNYGSLICTRLAMGVGEATTFPAGGRVVREWIPAGERGVTNAIFVAGTQAGPAVGALLVAWIVSQIGWRGSFVVVGAVGLIWLVAWLIWFDKPERVHWLGAEERAKILRERDAETSAMETAHPRDPRAGPAAHAHHVGTGAGGRLRGVYAVSVSDLAAELPADHPPSDHPEDRPVHGAALRRGGGAGHPARPFERPPADARRGRAGTAPDDGRGDDVVVGRDSVHAAGSRTSG